MTTSPAFGPGVVSPDRVVLRAAVAAYLGRYRGNTRLHTESDLRVFLTWCTGQELQPLSTTRADIERYVRWLQDVRRFQASTVSRRLSDRARKNLDRHPNYILAAYMASGT